MAREAAWSVGRPTARVDRASWPGALGLKPRPRTGASAPTIPGARAGRGRGASRPDALRRPGPPTQLRHRTTVFIPWSDVPRVRRDFLAYRPPDRGVLDIVDAFLALPPPPPAAPAPSAPAL